jgi:hypothetical protein
VDDGTVWVKVLSELGTTPTLLSESHWVSSTTVDTASADHTVSSSANAVFLFLASAPTSQAVTSVTFAGEAMTSLGTAAYAPTSPTPGPTDRRAEAWVLLDPPAGVGTWQVDHDGTLNHAVVVTDWANVNQTTPTSGYVTDAEYVANSPTSTSTSLDTDSAFPFVSFLALRNNSTTVAAGGDQTLVTQFTSSSLAQVIALTTQTAGTAATWTWGADASFAALGFTVEAV